MQDLPARLRAWLAKKGTARSRELVAKGLSRTQITRLKRAGVIVPISRGVYTLSDFKLSEHGALAIVASHKPGVVFCLLTALRLHDLTTQAPHQVWIAIANKDHPPRIAYPVLRTVRFSPHGLVEGIVTRKIDGLTIKLTDPARTVVDCFKFRYKIGLDVTLEALRDAYHSRSASLDDLWRHAQSQRVANVMRPYLESLT